MMKRKGKAAVQIGRRFFRDNEDGDYLNDNDRRCLHKWTLYGRETVTRQAQDNSYIESGHRYRWKL